MSLLLHARHKVIHVRVKKRLVTNLRLSRHANVTPGDKGVTASRSPRPRVPRPLGGPARSRSVPDYELKPTFSVPVSISTATARPRISRIRPSSGSEGSQFD